MPVANLTWSQFATRIAASGLASAPVAKAWFEERPHDCLKSLLAELVRRERLTSFQASALMRDPPMRLVFGRYQLLDLLGEGGMGQVFKARHDRLDRLVAVKLLHEHTLGSPEAVSRFHREVKTAGMLKHPNIVLAHDADEWEGRHYLVMEYVAGCDLAAISRERIVAIEEAASWIAQAAFGLAYAHGEGVVHRDVKPSNLLLDEAGVVKVLDLGIARVRGDDAIASEGTTATQLTRVGAIVGTVDFMAPEQALNLRHADARSDIYSLGCTLFQILTGRPAFDGATVIEKIIAHRECELPSLRSLRPDAPEALEAIVERMTAKRQEDRFQSMQEVGAALASLLDSSQVASEAPTTIAANLPGNLAANFAAPLAQPTLRLDANTAIVNRDVAAPSRLAHLKRLIDGSTAVDRFLCSDEENELFRAASNHGCSLEEIETTLAKACAEHGWTRQTMLSKELASLLAKASSDGAEIDRREFDEAIAWAVAQHMPRKAAIELCLTMILDKQLAVRQARGDKWFTRLCRQFGLN